MKNLSIDEFAGLVGEQFEVTVAETILPMTLVGAEPLEGSVREAGGFRLEFLGPSSPILAQAIMTVRRADLEHEIFMVPAASDQQGTRYEAVFF